MGILETYLNAKGMSLKQLHSQSGIAETTLKGVDTREVSKWRVEYVEAIAALLNCTPSKVLEEVLRMQAGKSARLGSFGIENRRYIGSKAKLLDWISDLVREHTAGTRFLDVFGGTGVVTKKMLPFFDSFIINDFLHSNYAVYRGFFGQESFRPELLLRKAEIFRELQGRATDDGYFSENYGNKYFSFHDSEIIGEIRDRIELDLELSERERFILIASLLYSADKVANTVGHYEAYRRTVEIKDRFSFDLISPVDTTDKQFSIHCEDANQLVRNVEVDVAFVDPPYNSRQYSRFYHVLEVLVKWDKPPLSGVAMKPPEENMSDYCRSSAPMAFKDLIENLQTNYVVVTYNNTYQSKSSSSRNKISHEQILEILNAVGSTQVFEQKHRYFNAGNTEFGDHKEMVFITQKG